MGAVYNTSAERQPLPIRPSPCRTQAAETVLFMKQFTHIVQNLYGLHARPAGLLARQAKTYADTVITLTKGAKTVRASQLLRVLSLDIQHGDIITVTMEGAEEETAWNDMQAFFLLNL